MVVFGSVQCEECTPRAQPSQIRIGAINMYVTLYASLCHFVQTIMTHDNTKMESERMREHIRVMDRKFTYLPYNGRLVEFIWYFIRIRFDASYKERIGLWTNTKKKKQKELFFTLFKSVLSQNQKKRRNRIRLLHRPDSGCPSERPASSETVPSR